MEDVTAIIENQMARKQKAKGRKPATPLDEEKALRYVKANLASYDVKIDDYEMAVEVLTTNLLVQHGIIPADWNYIIKCAQCGDVPYMLESDTTSLACPWCVAHIGVRNDKTRSRNTRKCS